MLMSENSSLIHNESDVLWVNPYISDQKQKQQQHQKKQQQKQNQQQNQPISSVNKNW